MGAERECPPEVAPAVAARGRALVALLALAEALPCPGHVPAALAQAESALARARAAQEELEKAREASGGPAVARGHLGDEDERRLQQLGELAQAAAAALEGEGQRIRRRQRWLRAGHGLAVGLMVLCGAVLSLDSVRAALGVAQDCHLLLALAAVALSCQVALRGLATSRRHLEEVAGHHRRRAQSLRQRAWRVATARASAEATAATGAATAEALGRLEEVAMWLGRLVAAVCRDREVTPWGTRGQGYPGAARLLGDIAVALGTEGEGGEEEGQVARRLQVAQVALAGRGEDTAETLSSLGGGDSSGDIPGTP